MASLEDPKTKVDLMEFLEGERYIVQTERFSTPTITHVILTNLTPTAYIIGIKRFSLSDIPREFGRFFEYKDKVKAPEKILQKINAVAIARLGHHDQ